MSVIRLSHIQGAAMWCGVVRWWFWLKVPSTLTCASVSVIKLRDIHGQPLGVAQAYSGAALWCVVQLAKTPSIMLCEYPLAMQISMQLGSDIFRGSYVVRYGVVGLAEIPLNSGLYASVLVIWLRHI